MKKFLLFFGLLVAITLFITHDGWTQTRQETKAPIITHAYAIDQGRLGTILKIYIEAEDPDGDMFKIATVVNQQGYGRHRTDWTLVKPQNRRHLLGYLQWNTLSSRAGWIDEWTHITIKVSIFDKSGKESNEVVLPFTFQTPIGSKPNPPAPFDKEDIPRLGHVMIELQGTTDAHAELWRKLE